MITARGNCKRHAAEGKYLRRHIRQSGCNGPDRFHRQFRRQANPFSSSSREISRSLLVVDVHERPDRMRTISNRPKAGDIVRLHHEIRVRSKVRHLPAFPLQ